MIFLHSKRVCLFFFFKQKTAYEMRISDWSSDVCSSDLADAGDDRHQDDLAALEPLFPLPFLQHDGEAAQSQRHARNAEPVGLPEFAEIGRASCRERVCQYV